MNAKPTVSCRRLVSIILFTLWAMLLGNSAARAQGVIIPAPLSIQCPSNIVLWTCSSNIIHQYPQPIVSGGCSDYQVICNPPPGTPWPIGVTTVTCGVIDGCQNAQRCTFTITVRPDTEPPSIRCPEDISVVACKNAAGVCGRVVNYPPPVATDNSGIVAVSCVPPSGSFFPCGETSVNCVAEDRCGNKDFCRFLVKVVEGDASPSIQCPPPQVITTCSNTAILKYPAPVVNPPGTTVVCVPPPGTVIPVGVTVVICTASNECGRAQCEFPVAVRPVPPVEIQCPGATAPIVVAVPCGTNCVPIAYPAPVVLNGTLESCTPPPGTCLPVGTYTVFCRATNECTVNVCKFELRVVPGQGEPPQIACPNDTVLTTCSNCAPALYPHPTVNNGVLLNCTPPSGTCLPVGVNPVSCVASNPCGIARCTFSIIVRPVPPPSIQCPTEPIVLTLRCGSNCVPIAYPPPVVVNGKLESCTPAPGTCLPAGVHTIKCRATNECGDSANCGFDIRIVTGQGVPPQIRCPQDMFVWTCDSNDVVVNYPDPTVIPGSDPTPAVVCQPPSGSVFPIGTTGVICVVRDNCGGEDRCTFTVTVRRDTLPPDIHCPSNIVHCVPRDTHGLAVNYDVTASDNADPSPEVVCEPPSGTFFPLGTTTVICRAKDKCGNESKCSFTVTLLPDVPPTLSIHEENGYVIVCWTKTCRCYKLQATRSLTPPIVWVDVEEEPVDTGTSYCLRLPLSRQHRFFRLLACDQPTAPVYGVASAGISRVQAARLADALNLPEDQLHLDGGALLFLDPAEFMSIPTDPIQDQALIDELARGSENDKSELSFEGINFEKLRGIQPVPGDKAMDLFERALRLADIMPDNGELQANHSMFEAEDPKGQPLMQPQAIDTHVNFQFHLGGIPLIGPGAKLNLALGPNGKPTALQVALRKLEPIQEIPILPMEEAVARCAKLYPGLQPNGSPRLVYFAPSLALGSVQKIIPCYECGGDGNANGQPVSLLRSLIPATDDTALVPAVQVVAVAQGDVVSARAVVKGGTEPYSFEWLSSSTDLGGAPSAPSIEYHAQPRAGETKETVRVFVTDANGIRVQASDVVEVSGGPGPLGFFAAVGGVRDYGTERAVSDMGAANQAGFNSRFDSDGVTRRFNWSGVGAWERDFREGPTGLDHLYVDNADITFYIGHGYGGGFTFESSHDDGTLYYTDAAGAWGDLDLEFLALLSCQVLKGTYDGKSWATRWGPSFAGLHLLLGFETNAHDWPDFGGRFADWALGRRLGFITLPGIPVRSAWFMAKAEEQPSSNIAVAMGVIGPAGCSNYNDYFWGKGAVGPDIRGNQIYGYWRVTYQ